MLPTEHGITYIPQSTIKSQKGIPLPWRLRYILLSQYLLGWAKRINCPRSCGSGALKIHIPLPNAELFGRAGEVLQVVLQKSKCVSAPDKETNRGCRQDLVALERCPQPRFMRWKHFAKYPRQEARWFLQPCDGVTKWAVRAKKKKKKRENAFARLWQRVLKTAE